MTLKVDLITPEKLSLSDEVDFISLPAVDGELGILPHHAPLLAQLGPEEIRLKKGNEEKHLAISGGFIEVQEGSFVEIFAETAEMEDDIDVARAEQAAEKAKTQLKSQTLVNPEDIVSAEAALRRALVRLKVAEGQTQSRLKGSTPKKDYN